MKILFVILFVLLFFAIVCLWCLRKKNVKNKYSFNRLPTNKAELYTIENFLSEEECNILCNLIDQEAIPSTVTGKETGHEYSAGRTSYTASFYDDNPFVKEINKKIHRKMKIRMKLGEPIQGQRYHEGQQFKSHYDYFMPDDFKFHCKDLGQRTYTFMIYLNEPEEGGETTFNKLNVTFKPKKGMAVVWNNLYENGIENPDTMHSGEPVKKGVKYIITKWFRKSK